MGIKYWKIKCKTCGKVFLVKPDIGRVPIHLPRKGLVDNQPEAEICNGSDTPGDIVEMVK